MGYLKKTLFARKKIGLYLGIFFALALGVVPVWGDTHYVATIGIDTPDCTNAGSPCQTIGYAIGQAIAGDTISVAAGTYSPAATIAVNKSLAILGPQTGVDPRPSFGTTRTPGNASTEAIVDGSNTLVTIFDIQANNVELNGLEVRNGTGDLIATPGTATLDNIAIRYNIVHDSSGDDAIQPKNVTNAVIEYNHVYGRAGYLASGDGISIGDGATGSMIRFNEVHDVNTQNSGIYVYSNGSAQLNVTINNNLVYNIATDGIRLGNKNGSEAGLNGGSILNNVVHDIYYNSLKPQQGAITIGTSNTVVEGNEVYNCVNDNGGIFVRFAVTNVTITSNSIHNNGIAGGVTTYGIQVGKGTTAYTTNVVVKFNRIVDNEGGLFYNRTTGTPPALNAENNWWGCNAGPGNAGCDTTSGNVDFNPWLVLGISAAPNSILTYENSTLTADLTYNSNGADTSASGHIRDGTTATFSGTLGGVTPLTSGTTNGKATSTFTAGSVAGTANVSSTVDHQTISTNISISNPVPTTTGLNPSSATAGDPGFTLTVNGTNFVNGSIVRWNGADRATTYGSATQLTATIPLGDIATAGTASVTVFNPTPGGGTSNPQTFTINNPLPTTTGLNPSSATAGDPGFTLTVNGTNFVNGSIVRWNGADRATTYGSATQLTATILAGDIATAGTASVTVFNPTPGGGTSNPQTFTINNPLPTTTGLNPSFATVGGPGFTLTVNGTNFVNGSIVRWNGSDRATTYISVTQLTASIPASDIDTAGTASVTVFNPTPDGGTSNPQTFTINKPVAVPTMTEWGMIIMTMLLGVSVTYFIKRRMRVGNQS